MTATTGTTANPPARHWCRFCSVFHLRPAGAEPLPDCEESALDIDPLLSLLWMEEPLEPPWASFGAAEEEGVEP